MPQTCARASRRGGSGAIRRRAGAGARESHSPGPAAEPPGSGSCPEKDLSLFLQSGFNRFVFRWLPSCWSRAYLWLLGGLFFALSSCKKAAILRALEHHRRRFGVADTLSGLWRRVRGGILDHYHEKLMLGFKPLDRLGRRLEKGLEVEGWEHLEAARARGKGLVVITGHYGAVEYLPLVLAQRGLAVSTMVHCKTASLRRRLEERAASFGARLLDPKEGSVVFSALQHLRENRLLMTQCDEVEMWRPYPDRELEFLGLSLPLDRALDLLVHKSGAPAVFCLLHRLPGGRHRLEVRPLETRAADGRRRSVSRQCLGLLGRRVVASPEAWYEWKKLDQFLPPLPEAEEFHHAATVGLPARAAVGVSR
jgi:lauroyl/myristoyl acyltransferase